MATALPDIGRWTATSRRRDIDGAAPGCAAYDRSSACGGDFQPSRARPLTTSRLL